MRFAYVTLLYGNSEAYLYALLMAKSLRWVNTEHEIVLLYNSDVPKSQLNLLEQVFDRLIPVNDIPVSQKLFVENVHSRFLRVFNKIHCLKLVEYDRVLMCDSDLLFLKNCDHLFSLNAPAALIHDDQFRYTHNVRGDSREAVSRYRRGMAYINAGVMLLEPSEKEFGNICEVITADWQEKQRFTTPEQAFLSGYYADSWHSLHLNYNFIIVFALGLKEPLLSTLAMDEISILHLVGTVKPLHYLAHPSERDPLDHSDFHQAVRDKVRRWRSGEEILFSQTSRQEFFASLNMLWIGDFVRALQELELKDVENLACISTKWLEEDLEIKMQRAELKRQKRIKRNQAAGNTRSLVLRSDGTTSVKVAQGARKLRF